MAPSGCRRGKRIDLGVNGGGVERKDWILAAAADVRCWSEMRKFLEGVGVGLVGETVRVWEGTGRDFRGFV
uniref:Uncharacterized protein n=1 Tax=Leersia perrieri TaxID=77586 RepID=A0A0D9XNE8_9ORYZ